MKYAIAPLDFESDFDSFINLSKLIYGDNAVTDKDMYKWLAEENIFTPGHSHLFHVAKDKDVVVASDFLQPVPLRIKDKSYLAAWSIKTMTHPEYRRQGIFAAMTEHNIHKARETGVDVILGFANASSFPGYKKFGWDVLFERRAVVRPLDISRPLKQKLKLAPLASALNAAFRAWDSLRRKKIKATLDITPETEMPQEAGKLWEEMKKEFPVLIERTPKYLDWRYIQRPRHDYQILAARHEQQLKGLLIFRYRQSNQSCILIDYIGPLEKDTICQLVHFLVEACIDKGIRYIISSSGETFDTLLEKHMHFKRLATAMANNMFIACIINPELQANMLSQANDWFYGYGDSELDIDLQPR